MKLPKLQTKPLPRAWPLRKLIGPSFILLGLGLGSGEVILWPFLASNYGMGIIWGAIVGITLQFFMNMEIERYALAHGESVFVGLKRKLSAIPWWFIFSTFLPWIWPGIAAASATLLVSVLGWSDDAQQWVAITMLIVMGLILSLGPVLYKTVERFQMVLISIGVPSIFLISIYLADRSDIGRVVNGIVGNGDGFWLLPAGISIASFLAALAYAGAGGNLNLAQSFYIKEKGIGMGKYAGRITSVLTGKKENKSILTGAKFNPNKRNVKEFNKWWRRINIEHFLVFWLTGSITIILLALLAYNTTFGVSSTSDISFVITEGAEIGKAIAPWVGTFFMLVAGLTLFGTQLTVYDATSRIISENVILASALKIKDKDVPKVYYGTLWLMIASGVVIFLSGFTQPLQLLILAAVLNAFAMFVHVGLTLWLNKTSLAKPIRPNGFRTSVMMFAFLFYGGFSAYVIYDQIRKYSENFENLGGYQLWGYGAVTLMILGMIFATYKIFHKKK